MILKTDVQRWFRRSAKGDKLVYYIGYLAYDRGPDEWPGKTDSQREITHLANYVLSLSDSGEVVLHQKRLGPDSYIYSVIRK